MKKKSVPMIIVAGLFLLSICYIVYLKQEILTQKEALLNLRVEVLEWQQAAEQEAQKAERAAADAVKAENAAQQAAKEALRQRDLAVIAQKQALRSK